MPAGMYGLKASRGGSALLHRTLGYALPEPPAKPVGP